ncbi:alpha/beta fold hydrolase [Leptolyngbya sp. O-77]|uniref:alpha/beta fold hydrolase n=1 Tax=Leptolyngbya sp. O-77 TaxID=1080068 RepID=UPI00074D3A59|nr:alpha/beta fold hydrolase [Leptolyngbya sp. O-77]BAU43854.1 2-hydroxy-6-oxo-6-(2'-aminophenyl)hexa-2, 4-dienoic acid hydrolase [Leptolyngbya sp. O-77]
MPLTQTPTISTQTWHWRGFPIRYQQAGSAGVPMLLVHGFGASSDHWRKNLPVLAQTNRVFAIDLIGFGYSAKPTPGEEIQYTFETWGQQLLDFCREVIGEPVLLVGNSIGCVAALQAAVLEPAWVRGVAMLDCSLRMLHDRKRATLPWYRRFGSVWLQQVLANRAIGQFFFSQIAQPKTVRKVLLQAYGRKDAVTNELVDLLLKPAFEPGAVDVFLAFIRYSQGPLAEDLLPQVTCPVLVLWGTEDPWEPIALGREFANYPCVQDFIPLEGLGHCPQDEAPEVVNPILQQWAAGF